MVAKSVFITNGVRQKTLDILWKIEYTGILKTPT